MNNKTLPKNLSINDKLIAKYDYEKGILFLKVIIDVCLDMESTELLCLNLIEFVEQKKFERIAYLNI